MVKQSIKNKVAKLQQEFTAKNVNLDALLEKCIQVEGLIDAWENYAPLDQLMVKITTKIVENYQEIRD